MQTVRTKSFGFTLVEIMIVVLIIGILLAIAIPNFVSARESSRAKACVANLKQIDSAKQQCAMDNKIPSGSGDTFVADLTSTSTSSSFQLVGTGAYLTSVPACPAGGTYALNSIDVQPTCSLATSGGTNYASGGKYYHGL